MRRCYACAYETRKPRGDLPPANHGQLPLPTSGDDTHRSASTKRATATIVAFDHLEPRGVAKGARSSGSSGPNGAEEKTRNNDPAAPRAQSPERRQVRDFRRGLPAGRAVEDPSPPCLRVWKSESLAIAYQSGETLGLLGRLHGTLDEAYRDELIARFPNSILRQERSVLTPRATVKRSSSSAH